MRTNIMSRKLTFSEILEAKPKKYEITDDRRLLFELQDGGKVELACEHCSNTYWDIGAREDEERLAFRLVCHQCFKGIYLLWIERERKK